MNSKIFFGLVDILKDSMHIFSPLKNLSKRIKDTRIKRSRDSSLRKYIRNGRRPWSEGYEVFKWSFIDQTLKNQNLLEVFRENLSLPAGYGEFLDERVVEYPWLVSRLCELQGKLLDAGSILNHQLLIEHPIFSDKELFILTLSPESNCFWNKAISYIFTDIRSLPFKDNFFDVIISISTLEHIGMDNTLIYTNNAQYKENTQGAYIQAVKELNRVLKPDGKCFVTVPFGQYQYDYFQQQFDSDMLHVIIDTFKPSKYIETFYKYANGGWNLATKEECLHCKYFNIHKTKYFDPSSSLDYDEDFAAAARAIAALEMVK